MTNSQPVDRIPNMATKRMKLTDQLRKAIETGGRSCYRLAKETGIDKSVLSRFLHHKGGLSMEGLDAIADNLGLDLVVRNKAKG